MKENRNKPKTGLVVLCGFLTLLMAVLLLASMCIRMHVKHNELPKAASALQLDKVDVENADGKRVSLAKLIAEDYIQDSTIAEASMQTVLREGNFRYIFGDKVNVWNTWLADGDGDFPELTEDECIAALKQNMALLYRETGFQLNADGETSLRSNMKGQLPAANKKLRSRLNNPLTRGMAAGWLGILAGILLAACVVWMIVMQVSGGNSAGKALRTCSTIAFVPSLALLVFGLASKSILSETAYSVAAGQLNGTWSTVGGIAVLGSVVLFGIGMLLKQSARPAQTAPAAQPVPQPSAPVQQPTAPAKPVSTAPEKEEPKQSRQFCRFCGKPLVNGDAKFCYKCGKKQE